MMEWIVQYLPARGVLESKLFLIPLFPFVGFLLPPRSANQSAVDVHRGVSSGTMEPT